MGWIKFFRSLFHPEGGSDVIYEHFHEMLTIGQQMFERVSAPLFDPNAVAPTNEDIRSLDAQINRLEKEIRSRLLTAVAVHPEEDTALRLLLLGLVRDAERCGDFSKHLFDVFQHSGGALPPCAHTDALREQQGFIRRLFDEVWEVYDAGNRERALQLLAEAKQFSLRDNAIVHALLAGDASPAPVAIALAARFFKRIQSHLAHVVDAVVVPQDSAAGTDPLLPEEDV